ncbi:MAG: hypothetical protein M1837_005073 [Sclerophora amabilis]|nr:MAG: hypothetical protein M1837_005073 [Sclerophora amabilis]
MCQFVRHEYACSHGTLSLLERCGYAPKHPTDLTGRFGGSCPVVGSFLYPDDISMVVWHRQKCDRQDCGWERPVGGGGTSSGSARQTKDGDEEGGQEGILIRANRQRRIKLLDRVETLYQQSATIRDRYDKIPPQCRGPPGVGVDEDDNIVKGMLDGRFVDGFNWRTAVEIASTRLELVGLCRAAHAPAEICVILTRVEKMLDMAELWTEAVCGSLKAMEARSQMSEVLQREFEDSRRSVPGALVYDSRWGECFMPHMIPTRRSDRVEDTRDVPRVFTGINDRGERINLLRDDVESPFPDDNDRSTASSGYSPRSVPPREQGRYYSYITEQTRADEDQPSTGQTAHTALSEDGRLERSRYLDGFSNAGRMENLSRSTVSPRSQDLPPNHHTLEPFQAPTGHSTAPQD